jgi:cytochrome c556
MPAAAAIPPQPIPPRRSLRRLAVMALIAAALTSGACRSQQEEFDKRREALTSLRATTLAVSEGWLKGEIPRNYARSTLQATAALLERERETLAAMPPDARSDPTARALASAQARLAKTLVAVGRAIDADEPSAVRKRMAALTVRALPTP